MPYEIFYEAGVPFQMITRESDETYDLVVVTDIGDVEIAWGDLPNEASIIIANFTDDDIKAKGGTRAFLEWGRIEAERRAKDHVANLRPPDNPTARVLFYCQYGVHATPDQSGLFVDPAPLP